MTIDNSRGKHTISWGYSSLGNVIKVLSARHLSPAWDSLAESYFQRRAFLLYSETYNPCHQRYYELSDDRGFVAGACVYSLKLNLLTFANIKSRVRFQIVGIPASISWPGLTGDTFSIIELLAGILDAERGMVLCLNLPPGLTARAAVSMRMLPTVLMRRFPGSWEGYLASLRSSYRRRLRKITEAFEGIRKETGPCSGFDEAMFGLYLQVMARTTTKLEELSLEYFRNLPPEFLLTTYRLDERVISWHITVQEGPRLTFFYGGTDGAFINDRHAYHNNILGILRFAQERCCTEIDLGQTAEIAKTRMGGTLVEKSMLAYSRNPFVRGIFRLGKGLLQYNTRIPEAHVFKRPLRSGS